MKQLFLSFVSLTLCICLVGCETLAAWQANPKIQFVELEAGKILASYFSNGGNANTAWGITQGFSTISDTATFIAQQKQGVAPSVTVAKTVKAFADDPTAINTLAADVSKLVAKIAPQTPAQSAAITQELSQQFSKLLLAQAP